MPTVKELMALATAKGIIGRSKMNKAELEKALGIKSKRRKSRSKSRKPCKAHQHRDPVTNRCRNKSKGRKPLKPCKDHQHRDPVTNRCRNKSRSRRSSPRRSRRSSPRRSRSSPRRSRSRRSSPRRSSPRRSSPRRSSPRRSSPRTKKRSKRGKPIFRKRYSPVKGSFSGKGYNITTSTGHKIFLPADAHDPTGYKYAASTSDMAYAMLYLLHKHKNDCIVAPADVCNAFSYGSQTMLWNAPAGILYIAGEVRAALKRCSQRKDVRFIVAPLYMYTSSSNAHYNYLVYDTHTEALERFEPHGGVSIGRYKTDKMDKAIVQSWGSLVPIREYYLPMSYCPRDAFQVYQAAEDKKTQGDAGFCAAWATWYADLRLGNPDVPREELVMYSLEVLKASPVTLTNFIRGYAKFVTKSKETYKNFAAAMKAEMCKNKNN